MSVEHRTSPYQLFLIKKKGWIYLHYHPNGKDDEIGQGKYAVREDDARRQPYGSQFHEQTKRVKR